MLARQNNKKSENCDSSLRQTENPKHDPALEYVQRASRALRNPSAERGSAEGFSMLSWGNMYLQAASRHSHSMASVLPSRHSSYTQFSASTRNACRRMTRCRVSSASGTKAGTTLKTFFKLRALSFCFCPKVRGGSPLEARWRRKRPF